MEDRDEDCFYWIVLSGDKVWETAFHVFYIRQLFPPFQPQRFGWSCLRWISPTDVHGHLPDIALIHPILFFLIAESLNRSILFFFILGLLYIFPVYLLRASCFTQLQIYLWFAGNNYKRISPWPISWHLLFQEQKVQSSSSVETANLQSSFFGGQMLKGLLVLSSAVEIIQK